MQQDNKPCRRLETRHVEVRNSLPACKKQYSEAECREQHADIWMFEKWGSYKINNTFVEKGSRAWSENGSESKARLKGCGRGEWMLGGEHTCGIGKYYAGVWRHLDDGNGWPLIEDQWDRVRKNEEREREREKERRELEKRNSADVKMEQGLADMDIDDGVKVKAEPMDDSDMENRSPLKIKLKIKTEFKEEHTEVDMY